MPLLFLERFPWPSLRTYTALSALALLAAGLSAYRALSQAPGEAAGTEPPGPRALDVAYYLLSDSLCVWVSPRRRRGLRARGLRGWHGIRPCQHRPAAGGRRAARGVSRYCCLGTARRIKRGLAGFLLLDLGRLRSRFPSLPARPRRCGAALEPSAPRVQPFSGLCFSPRAPSAPLPGGFGGSCWERLPPSRALAGLELLPALPDLPCLKSE